MTDPPRPSHHANASGTLFKNSWPSAAAPTWTELLQLPFPLGWYPKTLASNKRARKLEVVTPDWGESILSQRSLNKSRCVIGTWLGHAGCLAEVPLGDGKSLWCLFDPIFSQRAGPGQFAGPGRIQKVPCEMKDLPDVDVVFISHNHYDHLDFDSIKAVMQNFPKARYFVPLGNKTWLLGAGVREEMVFEMDWWGVSGFSQEQIDGKAEDESRAEQVRITCVPAQHNSGRGALDKDSTLWCGWVLEQFTRGKRNAALYHAGDTGYRRTASSSAVCPVFKEIGEKFGGFDLSFIPIWRGGTLSFISALGLRLSHEDIPTQFHGSPTDAISIHQDVRSRNTIGIHFGTFVGSEKESYEAMVELGDACDKQNVGELDDTEGENGRAGTLDIGASIVVELK